MKKLMNKHHELKIPAILKEEYPFTSRYFFIQEHRLHYVDWGEGEVLLLVHGNPTWSFFFRHLIKHFSKNYRVIAIDHLGCGLSDRPQDYAYQLINHIDNLDQFIQFLNLKSMTLVLHDWGGAIGMGLAERHPELIKKIVLMNTAAFLSDKIPWQINILKNPIGEWFIRQFNGFSYPATFIAPNKKLSPLIKLGFTLPYYDYQSRIATAKFVLDIPLKKNHPSYQVLKSIEENLSTIKCPILLLWGEKDFCFTMDFLKRWMVLFKDAKVNTYKNAGHYLIEDEPELITLDLEQFFKE